MSQCTNARAPFRWDDLRFFLAVIQSGSFLAAGKALGVDRTTVARRMEALERSFGKRLCDTEGMVIQPTSEGRTVLKTAERVSDELRELEQRLLGVETPVQGTVKIAVAQGLGDVLVSEMLALQAVHPDLQIEILNVADPMRHVAERKADLGIGDAYKRPERVDSTLLGNLEIAMYGAVGRSQGTPATVIGWSEYAPEPFIEWLDEHLGHTAVIGTRVNSWEALRSAVLTGQAAAPLWCMLADDDNRLERLTNKAAHYIALWLVSPEGIKRRPAQEAAWRVLREKIAHRVGAADR